MILDESGDAFQECYQRGDINIMFKVFMCLTLLCGFGTLSARATELSSDEQFKLNGNKALTQSDWNRLALSELQAGLTSKGLEHERKAMQLYSPKDAAALRSALGYLGDQVILTLTPDHAAECGQNFLANLKEVGRSEEADRLSRLKEGL